MSITIKVQNGDWYVDPAGRFQYIGDGITSGREKCSQDVADALLQDFNEETDWGSYLNDLPGSGAGLGTEEQHRMRIQSEVSNAIERLVSKQQLDNYATSDEKIDTYNVVVDRDMDRPLTYIYYLAVHTEAGDDTPLEKVYQVEIKQSQDPNLDLSKFVKLMEQSG